MTQFFLILLLVAVPNALQIAILVALLLLLVSNFTNKPLWVGAAAATHDSATAGAGASTMFRFTRTIPTLSYDAIFNISSSSLVCVDACLAPIVPCLELYHQLCWAGYSREELLGKKKSVKTTSEKKVSVVRLSTLGV